MIDMASTNDKYKFLSRKIDLIYLLKINSNFATVATAKVVLLVIYSILMIYLCDK